MLSHWWVSEALEVGGATYLSAWVIWVVVSITLHELAHGWVAIRLGDHTPEELGHMSFNPLVHMPPQALVLFVIVGITWGQMPVDTTRLRGKWGDAVVSLAGPAMNFVLAALCILVGGVWNGLLDPESGRTGPFSAKMVNDLNVFFVLGASLNISLGLFNLVPAPPLDGSRILANVWPAYRRFLERDIGVFVGMAALVVLFLVAGSVIYGFGTIVAFVGTGILSGVIRAIAGVPG